MTNAEALKNAIAEFNNNFEYTHTPFSFEYRTQAEKDKAHTETMVRIWTMMGEGNKRIVESGKE